MTGRPSFLSKAVKGLAHAIRATSKWLETHGKAIEAGRNLALGIVALVAPFLASSFEHRMSGTQLLSQREQAESELRATMFSDLISPIVGGRDAGELDTEREALLTELLALNFHEHFELKPLLQHVYDRAVAEPDSLRSRKLRESLRSIARRVKDRQIATLFAEGRSVHRHAEVWEIYIEEGKADSMNARTQRCYLGGFDETHLMDRLSPDSRHYVTIWTESPDWDNDNIHLNVVLRQAQDPGLTEMAAEFTLTPFDFPMTDNTRLDDGNRFAVIVANTSDQTRHRTQFRLKLVWFPKGYVMPHERPLNFRDLQLLGKGRG